MKWFVPEIHTEHALKLLRDETVLLAPDSLSDHALWRHNAINLYVGALSWAR